VALVLGAWPRAFFGWDLARGSWRFAAFERFAAEEVRFPILCDPEVLSCPVALLRPSPPELVLRPATTVSPDG
jgi:hypothetical protein